MQTSCILDSVIIGIGATLTIDLWNLFLNLSFNIPLPNYGLLGRWLLYMPKGKFKHAAISITEPKPFENLTGWISHYLVGIALATLFIHIAPAGWPRQPTLIPALTYGFCTAALPLLIMQPAYGLGIASSKTSHAIKSSLKSLVTHIVFGLGLYLTASMIMITSTLLLSY